jgi:hypothetical protein
MLSIVFNSFSEHLYTFILVPQAPVLTFDHFPAGSLAKSASPLVWFPQPSKAIYGLTYSTIFTGSSFH